MATPIPTGAFHVSRQKFAKTLDFQEVARNNEQIDTALAQATQVVEAELHRGFYPWIGTRYFDWPDRDNPVSYRIRLDDNELISLTSATAGGVALTVAHLVLYPPTGPPYSHVETSFEFSDVFQSGDTWQNAIAFTGTWGYQARTRSVGTLVGGINSSVTSLVLSDSSQVGVGDVLLLDSEYLVVRNVAAASTSQTLQTPLTASNAGTSVAVTTGTAYAVGEIVTLDSEQMLIVDITGNTLIVRRAYNGTVLASHTGSTIYAPRTYTVDRAACGSTAASHSNGITTYVHVIPAAVQSLSLAEASMIYGGHAAGWQTGSGSTRNSVSGSGLSSHRRAVRRAYGRKGRQRAV